MDSGSAGLRDSFLYRLQLPSFHELVQDLRGKEYYGGLDS